MIFRLIVLALAVCAAAAASALTRQEVAEALDASDFAALETLMSAEHTKARVSKDFGSLRTVYGAVFAKLHAERFQNVQKWFHTYPESPFAAAALAAGHYARAFAFRGEYTTAYTSPQARKAFVEEMAKSVQLARLSRHHAPDFIPAIDLSLQQIRVGAVPGSPWTLIKLAFEISPERATVFAALSSYGANWGNDGDSGLGPRAVCSGYADQVRDYDSELCWIEMVFLFDIQGRERTKAIEALDTRDEPFLDYIRLQAYLSEWRDRPEAEDVVYDLHLDALANGAAPRFFLETLSRINSSFPDPLYEAEAMDFLHATLRKRLKEDPQNPELLFYLIKDVIVRIQRGDPTADVSDARAYWEAMLPLGQYRHDTWEYGSELAFAEGGFYDFDRRFPYMQNMLVYGNHHPYVVSRVLMQVHLLYAELNKDTRANSDRPADPEAVLHEMACPMLRVARLYDAACGGWFPKDGCSERSLGQNVSSMVDHLSHRIKHCNWVAVAEPENLRFSPVSVDRFTGGY